MGNSLSPDLQEYVENSIRQLEDSRNVQRVQRITQALETQTGEFQYNPEALQKLSDLDRELLMAWNAGESSHVELAGRFNIKSNRLNLKMAALRAMGFPVREGQAMKSLAERIKVSADIDVAPNPELYDYDPDRLKDLPEKVQWLVDDRTIQGHRAQKAFFPCAADDPRDRADVPARVAGVDALGAMGEVEIFFNREAAALEDGEDHALAHARVYGAFNDDEVAAL